MKKLVNNLCVILIFMVFVVLIVIQNVQYKTIPVIVESGSYADIVASEKHLPKAEITDDLKSELDIRYEGEQVETVRANLADEKGDYIEITKGDVVVRVYDDGTITNGIEELDIDSKIVTTTTQITETVDTEKVYLIQPGDTLGKIALNEGMGIYEIAEANGIENVNLIYAGESLSIPSQKTVSEITTITVETNRKEGVTTKETAAFHYVVSPLSACQFGYNIVNDEIELIYYYGTEKDLIIPSHIAGYPVTKIAFDMVGNYDTVVIPATVTSITGKVAETIYSPIFFIEMIFSVLAFLIVLISLNILLPRLKKKKEYLLSGPHIVISFLYLIAQCVFAILTIYKYVILTPYQALIISVVFLAVFMLVVMMGGTGRKHIVSLEQKLAEQTDFMKTFSRECMDLSDGITDKEVKKQVDRLVEDIRFSDKISVPALSEIEEELQANVQALRNAISGGDTESVLSACRKAKNTLDKRNRMAKDFK